MAWYTAASSGATCVAAYDAVGAASLADSYTNEANPGTYDAAPGVAPTWAAGTGWAFNGTTQYLTTGVVLASGYSVVVRYGGVTTGLARTLFGARDASSRFHLDTARFHYGGASAVWTDGAAGVKALASATGYVNAVSFGASGGSAGVTTAGTIGARNNNGTIDQFLAGNIQALAIYSGTLSAADVATITTAMDALPAPGGHPYYYRNFVIGDDD